MIGKLIKTAMLTAFFVGAVEAHTSWAASAEIIEGQKKVASEIKPTLPKRIDEYTLVIDITASNETLIQTYLIQSHKMKNMTPNFIDLVRKNTLSTACKSDAFKKRLGSWCCLPLYLL